MENPLCYRNKKMDIRQWVLVTDWNPLTIWFFQECYVRLSTNDYSLKNIKNRFTHLTNNSVNKRSDNFVKEDGFASQSEFSEYMESIYGEGSWKKIVRQMKK
jgi:tubulin monoglycylase TTLL3/8